MKTRFFSFGCSYTNFNSLTWADYLGQNFDEYYNFGKSGASNTYIMNKFIEINSHFNFDSNTDLVVVMLTGFNRFNWINDLGTAPEWECHGDIDLWLQTQDCHEKYPYVKGFIQNMWNFKMAIYTSWIAVKTIKTILTSNNINHKILTAFDYASYIPISNIINIDSISINYIKDICSIIDVKESVNEFRKRKNFNTNNHPTPDQHFNFAYEYFPESMTKLPTKITNISVKRNSVNLPCYG